MTTINLNQLKTEWRNINYAMSLSDARIKRLCNSTNKEDAISVGFWDRFCDLFRPEKKAEVLEAVWNFIHSADNSAPGNEETLPEKAIKAFLCLKGLSNEPDTFVTKLEMTTQEQGRYVLQAVFRINNEMVGNITHEFTNKNMMENWISNNQLDPVHKLKMLESVTRNGIDPHSVSFWNRFCNLFCPEKKAEVLEAVWNFIHSADNNSSGNEETLLPKNAIEAFRRLRKLSNKHDAFNTELEMTKQEQGRYVLQTVFRINDEMVKNATHEFTNTDTMKSWISNNRLDPLQQQEILESAVRNDIDLQGIHLNHSLWMAKLQKAKLQKATLANIDLRGADLRGADLRGADLRGANLWGADLRGAQLGDNEITWATMAKVKMKGATYNGKALTRENFSQYLTGARNTHLIDWDS
ncbi:hypothetical protein F9222_24565 [Escherichia coli]|nr:hypothetical protein F9222_24565 [Escherichia coli]